MQYASTVLAIHSSQFTPRWACTPPRVVPWASHKFQISFGIQKHCSCSGNFRENFPRSSDSDIVIPQLKISSTCEIQMQTFMIQRNKYTVRSETKHNSSSKLRSNINFAWSNGPYHKNSHQMPTTTIVKHSLPYTHPSQSHESGLVEMGHQLSP